MAYDDKGGVKKLTDVEQAALSRPAITHLRFSPKKFTIEPKSFQYIAFTYRRQINDEPAEHRTYVDIQCFPLNKKTKKGINLKYDTNQEKITASIQKVLDEFSSQNPTEKTS